MTEEPRSHPGDAGVGCSREPRGVGVAPRVERQAAVVQTEFADDERPRGAPRGARDGGAAKALFVAGVAARCFSG